MIKKEQIPLENISVQKNVRKGQWGVLYVVLTYINIYIFMNL